MKKIFPLFLFIAFAITNPTLEAVETKNVKTYENGKTSVASTKNGDLQIVANAFDLTNSSASFLFSIANTGTDSYYFYEGDIALYSGNASKDKWKLEKTWDSLQYLRDYKKSENAALFTILGITTALVILDIILESDSDYHSS
mgnify:CR=1 FL=1